MKCLVLFCALLLGSSLALFGQLVLNPGDTWTYNFSSLSFRGGTNVFQTTTHGEFGFTVRSGSFDPGDSLAYEMFENSTNEAPICSGTMTGSPYSVVCSAPNGWQDVQGVVRFRMLSGSVIVDNITLKAITTSPSLSSYYLYQDSFTPATSLALGYTNIQTVFLILMENVTWSEIKGSSNAPYINNVLLPLSSYCDNFFTAPNTSGSLPQYLWLEAGTNFGINDSSDPASHHIASTNHLVIQLQNAGISWKAYQEDINGTNCPTSSSGLYAAFHNQYVYFDDIYLNSINCSNHIRPYPELTRDLTNNTVPRYCFITPNLCNDMHNSTGCATPSRVRNGDNWLSAEIPKILASSAYSNNGAIFITWDEGTGGATGPFGTIVISPWAKGGGYRNTNRFDHASTLRTVQEIFGVRPFLYAAASATSLSDLFKPVLQLASPAVRTNVFSFTVSGLSPGKTNLFQFTGDFLGWTNILTNVVTTNSFIFSDRTASNSPSRFYRVLENP